MEDSAEKSHSTASAKDGLLAGCTLAGIWCDHEPPADAALPILLNQAPQGSYGSGHMRFSLSGPMVLTRS